MRTKSRISAACVIAALLLSATDTPAATITVTNGNDSGPGSLRQAIVNASSGDTINFAPSITTVNLTSGQLVIDKNLTVTGPGANRLTVQRSTGGPDFRIFNITSNSVTASISGLTVSNGSVRDDDGDGGGIRNAGVLTLTDCTISGNRAEAYGYTPHFVFGGSGGGVLNRGTMTIMRCTISNNSAIGHAALENSSGGYGGGIWNVGSLIIGNSTINGNFVSAEGSIELHGASGGGGGIFNPGSITITNCTVSGNSGVGTYPATMGGGGIFGSGPTTSDSSIIALNSAPFGPDLGGLHSTGYNIIGNNADAVISSQPTDQIGTPAAPIDPLLGPLADNGGPTLTHALQSGSLAIDRGDPAAPPQDQRGYGRVGVPDVGAFEYAGVPPATASNTSTRAFVQTGENVMIGGFIVQGTEPKRVIIRAIGPELTQYGVPNALVNPALELHDSSRALIASNDNWQHTIIGGIITSDQRGDIQNSGHAPTDGRESAIIAELPAGNYTAIVRGVNNTMGVALVEVYDLSPESNSILSNISTRSFVQTGDNVMIGGFIVAGTELKRVIVRAIGPELTQYDVPNVLANPTLELHDGSGALIASNDNWTHTIIGGIITTDQVVAILASGHAPGDNRESAIIAELPAGNYTAIVRGVNNTTGVALVEVYDLDQ